MWILFIVWFLVGILAALTLGRATRWAGEPTENITRSGTKKVAGFVIPQVRFRTLLH
ncbi:MAG: hypothetical protein BMS9Abin36_1328 [Gammaproteobacteria bacterium]|nr:MAG: hypothetical protein BMS9Abin36_1328 [Gammaproteobacteria bacterium]